MNSITQAHYSSNTTTENLLIRPMLSLSKKSIYFSKKAFSELEKLGEGAAYAIQK